MIQILTLFVGLVTGVQNVDVAADEQVARVELRIGARTVASAVAPPWRLRVDFGQQPSPTELVAVAFDPSGRELGRDERWLNVPTARAEVTILPEIGTDGRVVAARLGWASPEFERPRRVLARVDDERIPVNDELWVDLARFAPGRPHVLEVELRFTKEVTARSELVFGERFAGRHDTGLTAAPVVLLEGDRLPSAAELQGWFVEGSQPLRVAAVEQPSATVVVVPHPSARQALEDLSRELDERRTRRGRRRSPVPSDSLGDADLYVLLPEPVVMAGSGSRPSLLFPVNEEPMAGADGILTAALVPDRTSMIVSDFRLANAIAAAGLQAARDNDRRVVLLLLGPEIGDVSTLDPTAARSYLRQLRVPLVVWDLSGDRPVQPGWGAADVVTNVAELADATRALRYLIDQQWIVWLNGRHLPQDITLSDAARGVILARGDGR